MQYARNIDELHFCFALRFSSCMHFVCRYVRAAVLLVVGRVFLRYMTICQNIIRCNSSYVCEYRLFMCVCVYAFIHGTGTIAHAAYTSIWWSECESLRIS